MRSISLLSAMVVVFASAGCNILNARDARCDLRPNKDQCTDQRDFRGPSFFTFQGVCDMLKSAGGGGTFTEDARCDMAGAIGGCQSSSADGTKQTNWYYSGTKYKTEADATAECDSGQSFVAPTP